MFQKTLLVDSAGLDFFDLYAAHENCGGNRGAVKRISPIEGVEDLKTHFLLGRSERSRKN